MNLSSIFTKKRIITIILVLIVVGGFFYFYSSRTSSSTNVTSLDGGQIDNRVTVQPAFSAQGARTVSLLLELERTTFPQSVFSSPSFSSLTDNTVTITAEEPGRENPFAPLGTGSRPGLRKIQPSSASTSASSTSTTTARTSQPLNDQ